MTGAQAPNYTLTAPTLSAAITAKSITAQGTLSGGGKTYNGTTTATPSGSPALQAAEAAGTGTTSDGKPYTGDTLGLRIAGGTPYTFNSKDVATATTITANGLVLGGLQAGNYSLTAPSWSASISAKALTAQGSLSGGGKIYDGTTTATPSGSAALQTAEAAGTGATSDGKPYAGDAVSLTGSASYAFNSKDVTTATTITASGLNLAGAQAGNYILTAPALSAGITPTASGMTLASSLNPSGYKDNVNFTATMISLATGTVSFQTNNTTYSTIAISSGIASSGATSQLPRGNNSITAIYLGDGNVLGSTNIISETVTNHPPVANTINVYRTAGLRERIFWSAVTNNNWTDTDGDSVSLTSFNLTSTNGVTVATNGLQILYPASGANVNDQLTYGIQDSYGGTNVGIINIVVNPFTTGQASAALSVSSGSLTTKFYGIPGYVYQIQRSTNFGAGMGWVTIQTNTVGANGTINVTDSFADLGGQIPSSAYYRLKWQP